MLPTPLPWSTSSADLQQLTEVFVVPLTQTTPHSQSPATASSLAAMPSVTSSRVLMTLLIDTAHSPITQDCELDNNLPLSAKLEAAVPGHCCCNESCQQGSGHGCGSTRLTHTQPTTNRYHSVLRLPPSLGDPSNKSDIDASLLSTSQFTLWKHLEFVSCAADGEHGICS